jgi:HEAT repeat protein
LLDATLPKEGAKLRDWQAVVIGGGIINGVSLSGGWPKPRIEELISKDEALRRRWQQALTAAATMADDAKVKTGTRYDALRMIALDPTEVRVAQLARYLAKDTDAELQMGAVSGLSDVDQPEAAKLIAESLPGLAPDNRVLAIDALLRTNARADALLGLLEGGKLAPATLSEPQRKKLRELPAGKLRDRAEAILKGIK